MDNYFKTVNNCVTIESYILNQIKSYLFRTLSETVDQKFTLIEIGISILCFRRRPQQIGLRPLHVDVDC